MKDFVKWLGVNDKIAKLIIWVFVIMVMLVVFNAALDSFKVPHYQITYDNLKQINVYKIFQYFINWITILLSFYAIVLLIFRVKDAKYLFKYSLVFLIIDVIIAKNLNYAAVQVFICLYIILLSYFYSGKKKKYILLAIVSIMVNLMLQGLTYYYKVKLIDYSAVNQLTKTFLFSDYFIIIGIIILVREIYFKKRSDKNGL